MANPWFRLYTEFATDPKVQALSEALQRRYVMLLCLKCNGDLDNVTQDNARVTESVTLKIIATALRVTEEEAAKTKKSLIDFGFIDDSWNILGWEKRQYISDLKDATNAERQRRYRERKRNEKGKNSNSRSNGTVTAKKRPDTYTDTDIKHKNPLAVSHETPDASEGNADLFRDREASTSPSQTEGETPPLRLEFGGQHESLGPGEPLRQAEKSVDRVEQEFGELRAKYPPRAGANPWTGAKGALGAYRARKREGHTFAEMRDGLGRYARFCTATGKLHTESVMQAKRFFGPGKEFLNTWALPAHFSNGRPGMQSTRSQSVAEGLSSRDWAANVAGAHDYSDGEVIQ